MPEPDPRQSAIIPDFCGVSDVDEIQRRFHRSAEAIMLKHNLVFGHFEKKRYMRITGLELYLHCNAWADPNTDRCDKQKMSNTWYVRRRGKNANTSRIDITAGSADQNIYCGLLLRGVDGTDGSGKAIKKILRGYAPSRWDWEDNEITVLDEIDGASVTDGLLRLEPRVEPYQGKLAFQMRVGLEHSQDPWGDCWLGVIVDQSYT